MIVKPNINTLENAYAFLLYIQRLLTEDMPKTRPGASPWDDNVEWGR